jgi:hypothetical protein
LPKLQPVHRLTRPDLKHLHKIGEGAFGEVSLASAPLYGNVAVKWLKVGLNHYEAQMQADMAAEAADLESRYQG